MSEAADLQALAEWVAYHAAREPTLALLFHVPNGELRHPVVASRLKRQLVRPGVPDLFLPVARGPFHGLWIELKTATGRLSAHQAGWVDRLRAEGYAVSVCRGWEAAARQVLSYLHLDRQPRPGGVKRWDIHLPHTPHAYAQRN